MSHTYEAGSLVTVATYEGTVGSPTGGFRDRNGVLADPITPTLRYQKPNGSIVTVTGVVAPMIRDGVGLYRADLDTTALPGVWQYEWLAPPGDPVQAAAVEMFTVISPGF